jgi:hypothetical protein
MQAKTRFRAKTCFAAVSMGVVLYGCGNQGEVSGVQRSRGSAEPVDQAAPLLVTARHSAGPIRQWGKDARFLELLPELQELEGL